MLTFNHFISESEDPGVNIKFYIVHYADNGRWNAITDGPSTGPRLWTSLSDVTNTVKFWATTNVSQYPDLKYATAFRILEYTVPGASGRAISTIKKSK